MAEGVILKRRGRSMFVSTITLLLLSDLVAGQYGPLKGTGRRTTTPFPSPQDNSVVDDEGVLSTAYQRPAPAAAPAGAVARPDNPWLTGQIAQYPAPAPASAPSYGPAPAPAPVQCSGPLSVCVSSYQCQGGYTSAPHAAPPTQGQCRPGEICCQRRPEQPQQPAYAPPPPPPPAQSVYQSQPAYQPRPQPQPVYQAQPQPQPAYQAQPQPQPAYQAQPQPQPAYQPQPQPQPAYQPRPQPAYQAQPQPQPAYQPRPQPRPPQAKYPQPIGGSIYDNVQPIPQSRPAYSNYVTEAPYQKYTGPLNTTPHPGCAAALKCVEEIYCTWDGVMADAPQSLTREQIENKVPLSDCQNIETGIIGKCCRDPNYKDPWPGGMMMMNNGPFDDGQYHGENYNYNQPQYAKPAAPAPAPAPQPQQPYYAQPQPQPQQPVYAPQPAPGPIAQQPQQPFYAAQPTYPVQQQRPQGSQNQRESCGVSAVCTTVSLCPADRLSQPGKQCRVPNDDSTGVCCKKLQFPPLPSKVNNVQYAPPPAPSPAYPPYPRPQPARSNVAPVQPVSTTTQTTTATSATTPVTPAAKPDSSNDISSSSSSSEEDDLPIATRPPPIRRPTPGGYPPASTPAEPKSSQPQPEEERSQQPLPDECGIRRQVTRPNGPAGIETGFGEFPWQVQVMVDGKPKCSGAILSNNIVITAAHCVDKVNSASVSVKAGEWKLGGQQEKPSQTRAVAAISVHPEFDPNSQFNDQAVLVLNQPFDKDTHIDKLCLSSSDNTNSKNCVITGWGKNSLQTQQPESTMHSIPVSFMPNEQCQSAFRSTPLLGKYFQLHKSFNCVLPNSPNHDLCQVDVGSPVACEKPDKPGQYELAGIYSWDLGCHPNTNVPAAMTKIDKDFVQSVMDKPVEQLQQEQQQQQQPQPTEATNTANKPGFSQGYGRK